MATSTVQFTRTVTKAARRPLSSRCQSNTPSQLSSVSLPIQHSSRKIHTPAMGDIGSDGAPAFEARQKEFRERLAAAKTQADSQSKSPTPSRSDSSAASSPSSSSSSPGVMGASGESHGGGDVPASAFLSGAPSEKALGSLSPSFTGEAREAARKQDSTSSAESSASAESAQEERGKKMGPLSSLFYGTEEGRQHDREIERSYSQVLARGKYVHSIVFHEVKPDKVEEYMELVGSWYPKIAGMPENKVHLVGSWRTEVGDCDTFVHIWEYQRYHGYHDSLRHIQHLPDFSAFDSKLKNLIISKRMSLMQEFSFWPTTTPRKLGGLFELRSYTLHPGNLLEWETHWRKGLEARRQLMEGVGAWFVQIGDLNTVHHLWQFADLEERRLRREQSWSIEGWSDTVHKTVPLIQTMKSRIMMPCEWSPTG